MFKKYPGYNCKYLIIIFYSWDSQILGWIPLIQILHFGWRGKNGINSMLECYTILSFPSTHFLSYLSQVCMKQILRVKSPGFEEFWSHFQFPAGIPGTNFDLGLSALSLSSFQAGVPKLKPHTSLLIATSWHFLNSILFRRRRRCYQSSDEKLLGVSRFLLFVLLRGWALAKQGENVNGSVVYLLYFVRRHKGKIPHAECKA